MTKDKSILLVESVESVAKGFDGRIAAQDTMKLLELVKYLMKEKEMI